MRQTLEQHAETMRERYSTGPQRRVGPLAHIHRVVKARFGFEFNLPGKARHEATARQVSMYLMKRLLPWVSYPIIGRYYGCRHHTTVLYAIQQIELHRTQDENLDKLLKDLEVELGLAHTVKPPDSPSAARRLLIAEVLERGGVSAGG